jgi:hypothetical protein
MVQKVVNVNYINKNLERRCVDMKEELFALFLIGGWIVAHWCFYSLTADYFKVEYENGTEKIYKIVRREKLTLFLAEMRENMAENTDINYKVKSFTPISIFKYQRIKKLQRFKKAMFNEYKKGLRKNENNRKLKSRNRRKQKVS